MPPPKDLMKESRYDKRRSIVTLHGIGKSPAEIHRDTGYPETTIRDVVKRYTKRGHIHDAPRSGRPPALNTWDKKQLEKVVEDEPASSLHKIAETAHLTCSPTTVDKALKEAKLTLHVKRLKP
jgi:transposase